MASAAEYAQWIVQNADKRGTPEFDTVARAYEAARRQETAPAPAVQPAVEPQRSMGDRIVGALETAGTMATGAVAAPVAAVGGLVAGVGQQILSGKYDAQQASQAVDQYAQRIAGAMTMQPQTAAGREYVGAIGQVGEALGPMQGLVPQSAVITQAIRNATPAMQTAATVGAIRAGEVAQQAGQRVQQGAQAVRGMLPGGAEAAAAPRTMGGSVGAAAGAEASAMREATAAQLPVPVTLTRGAATRDAQQLAFEKEAMKTEAGAPLRNRAEENNMQVLQNFDVLIDDTGAQIRADPAAVGRTVTGALVESAAKDKARVRVAYKEAEKAGDMAAPVSTAGIAEFLDANVSAESTAGILGVARKELVRLGGATVDPETGRLIPGELSINNMEQLRKLINKSKDTDATNGKFGRDVIGAIDAATEGQGGEKYKTARALRRQYAEDYENRAIVANLLTNRRGMDDPRVAIDQVFKKSILNGSPEDIRFLRQVLDKGGENGAQAWRELQGATVEHIRSQAAQGLQTDSMGNAIVSPAKLNQTVRQLDSNGRLDLVLGKKQAQTLRDLNEVLQYVTTVPPGTLVNTSGTAGMLMAAMAETGALSMVGLPLPVLTGIKAVSNKMKDVKLRRRIDDALNAAKAKEKRERVTGQSL